MCKQVLFLFLVPFCFIHCSPNDKFACSNISQKMLEYSATCYETYENSYPVRYSHNIIEESPECAKEQYSSWNEQNIMKLWKIYPLNIMENSTRITSACSNAYNKFLKGLYQNNMNSVKMFDASAKLPSGLLRGNVNQYGDFDECMELDEAQYCLAEINIEPIWKQPYLKFKDLVHSNFVIQETLDDPKHRVPGFTMIRWGFCIPRECTNEDLESAIEEKLQIQSKIRPSMCQPAQRGPRELTHGDIIARSFFLLIVLFVSLSTYYYDSISHRENRSTWLKLLGSFSLQKNYNELTTTKENSKEIQALHGVRALSALALIISHKVMALFYNPYMNRSVMTENLGMKWTVIGRTAILYTECFMLLSGLLNANSLFADLDKANTMKFKTKVLSRLFRLPEDQILNGTDNQLEDDIENEHYTKDINQQQPTRACQNKKRIKYCVCSQFTCYNNDNRLLMSIDKNKYTSPGGGKMEV